jgi:hypothetical protein
MVIQWNIMCRDTTGIIASCFMVEGLTRYYKPLLRDNTFDK